MHISEHVETLQVQSMTVVHVGKRALLTKAWFSLIIGRGYNGSVWAEVKNIYTEHK